MHLLDLTPDYLCAHYGIYVNNKKAVMDLKSFKKIIKESSRQANLAIFELTGLISAQFDNVMWLLENVNGM